MLIRTFVGAACILSVCSSAMARGDSARLNTTVINPVAIGPGEFDSPAAGLLSEVGSSINVYGAGQLSGTFALLGATDLVSPATAQDDSTAPDALVVFVDGAANPLAWPGRPHNPLGGSVAGSTSGQQTSGGTGGAGQLAQGLISVPGPGAATVVGLLGVAGARRRRVVR